MFEIRQSKERYKFKIMMLNIGFVHLIQNANHKLFIFVDKLLII